MRVNSPSAQANASVRYRMLFDFLLASAMAFAFFALAQKYVDMLITNSGSHFFYQSYYEAAVRVACGMPFGYELNHTNQNMIPLLDFLAQKTRVLACENVPPYDNFNPHPPVSIWYYLMMFTASIWKFTGVTWEVVEHFSALFIGFSTGILYLLFRLLLPRLMAIGLTAFCMLPSLAHVLLLRDIVKFPFVLAVLYAIVFIFTRSTEKEFRINTLIIVSALTGGIVGLGYGFRPDVLILIPVFFLALPAVVAPTTNWFSTLVLCLLAFFGALLLLMSPMLVLPSTLSGCFSHFVMLGLSEGHTIAMGAGPDSFFNPDYHLTLFYSDSHVSDIITARFNLENAGQHLKFCSETYTEVGYRILFDMVTTFPFDMLKRGLLVAWNVLGLPFELTNKIIIAETLNIIGLDGLLPMSQDFLSLDTLRLASLLAWFIVLLITLRLSRILFLTILLSLLYVVAYPAIQFSPRHYYYLAFISPLPFAVIYYSCRRVLEPTHNKTSSLQDNLWGFVHIYRDFPFGFLLTTFAAVAFVLTVSFTWQLASKRSLIDAYLNAEITNPPIVSQNNQNFEIPWLNFISENTTPKAQILRIDLGGDNCPEGQHSINVTYSDNNVSPHSIHSKVTKWQQTTGLQKSIFRPVLYRKTHKVFLDLGESGATRECIKSIGWVDIESVPKLHIHAEIDT